MCEGSWRRRSAVVQEPTAHVQEAVPDQTPNRVHALFFTFSWFQLSLMQAPSCQQHLSFLQEQPFRLLAWGCWTPDFPVLSAGLSIVPFNVQHPWSPALQRSCISPGLLLGVCVPACLMSCSGAVHTGLGGIVSFRLYSTPWAGSEAALSPEVRVPCFGSKHKMGDHSFLRGRFSAFLKVVTCSSWWCFVFSWITKLSLPQWYYFYSFLPQCCKSISFLLFLTVKA